MGVERELGIQAPYLQWLPHPAAVAPVTLGRLYWRGAGCLEPKFVFSGRWAALLLPEHDILAEMWKLCM